MRPDGRPQRPHTVRVLQLKLLSYLTQHRVIVGTFVNAHPSPVDGLGRRTRLRVILGDRSISLLRLVPAFVHERETRQPHLQPCAKFPWGQITFEPHSLDSV